MSTSPVYTDLPEAAREQPHGAAVAIANAQYEHPDLPNVDHALRDAQVMKKYLVRTFGVPAENVRVEKNAPRSVLERMFGSEDAPGGELQRSIEPGTTDVFVYYSGRAAVQSESGEAYFLPSDAAPDSISQSGYPARQFYDALAGRSARSVTVVLDASRVGIADPDAGVPNVSPAVRLLQNHDGQIANIENGLVFAPGPPIP